MTNIFRSLSVLKPKEEKVIIFGNDACGKTTLLYQLKLNQLVSTIPTIGFNIERMKHRDKTFEMWDVGGMHDGLLQCLRIELIRMYRL
jgi:small GTP-binding protein